MDQLNPQNYLKKARLIHSEQAVNQAISTIADQLNIDYASQSPTLLCVMSGGVFFAGQLLPKLKFLLSFDYIHATRYHALQGKSLDWLVQPKSNILGKDVIILDDILDEGITLKAIVDACESLGAKSIKTAVLLEKQLAIKKPIYADYVGLVVPNQYVFGCGMDVDGWWRNLPAVYAL